MLFTLMSFTVFLRGRTVVLEVDNMTARAYLDHHGGPDPTLMGIMRRIWMWAVENEVTLWKAKWLPSAANSVADFQSRAVDWSDWQVHPHVFQWLDRLWGPHSVDRMADSSNTHLPRFNSWRRCPGAETVNCFAADWAGENNWVVPPFGLIMHVLLHVQECRCMATVIVPHWEAQAWWPVLQDMAIDSRPMWPGFHSFRAGPSGASPEPFGNPHWHNMLAVRVDGARRAAMAAS